MASITAHPDMLLSVGVREKSFEVAQMVGLKSGLVEYISLATAVEGEIDGDLVGWLVYTFGIELHDPINPPYHLMGELHVQFTTHRTRYKITSWGSNPEWIEVNIFTLIPEPRNLLKDPAIQLSLILGIIKNWVGQLVKNDYEGWGRLTEVYQKLCANPLTIHIPTHPAASRAV